MRAPVEVLFGSAAGAAQEIGDDFAMLDSSAGQTAVRAWSCDEMAVVLGVSRDLDAEVDLVECDRRGIAVLRRASGGGTVVIGPGTLQYAFLVPHAPGLEPPPIDAVKQRCNAIVQSALAAAGVSAALESDRSGDLRSGARKVGGVSLRRRREATLLHGTLLVEADLAVVAAVLRHPLREPAWRGGRSHLEFLANLGAFDRGVFLRALGTIALHNGPNPSHTP